MEISHDNRAFGTMCDSVLMSVLRLPYQVCIEYVYILIYVLCAYGSVVKPVQNNSDHIKLGD